MPAYFTPEDSQKALANAATLDDVVNGEVGQIVTSPDGRVYPALAEAIAQIEQVTDNAELTAQQKLAALQTLINNAQASTNTEISNLQQAIQIAAAAGAGANGWTDLLITLPNGRNQRDKNGDYLTTNDFPKLSGEPDDTLRLQRAFDASAATLKTLKMIGTFSASDTLYVSHNLDGEGAIINYPLDYKKHALVFSIEKNTTTKTRIYNKRMRFPQLSMTKSSAANDWTSNAGSIAIKLMNPMECKFWFQETITFEYGVYCLANGVDANYNEYNFGTHKFHKRPFTQEVNGTSTRASANQNRYLLGRFAINITDERVLGTYLMHFFITGSTSSSCNNNLISTSSVEGSADEYAMLFQNAGGATNVISYNTIIAPRLEAVNVAGKSITFDGQRVRWNTIIGGYGVVLASVREVNGAADNLIISNTGTIIAAGSTGITAPLICKNSTSVGNPAFAIFSSNAGLAEYADPVNNAVCYATAATLVCRAATSAYPRLTISFGSGKMSWGGGASDPDTTLYRTSTGLKTDNKFLAAGGIGVGNAVSATTVGTLTRKIQVFDENGVSLGFVPVYSTIT